MEHDILTPVLRHFDARARTFFTGNLCERADFPVERGVGYLHLLRGGRARLREKQGTAIRLDRPTLILYSRPIAHWFEPDPDTGADLACASVSFSRRAFNPISLALPPRFQCDLSELDEISPLFGLMFSEAFGARPGRTEVLDRLFEIVLIELLRIAVTETQERRAFLSGLEHPRIAGVLAAMHEDPGADWSLEALASVAHMSRSNFAEVFRREVGTTPGEYLARWRITVAQALMLDGVGLAVAAERVGYTSFAGFSRSFRRVTGSAPGAWLKNERAE